MLEMKKKRLLVRDVNPCITCILCQGYFIEPATIIECLHSFCRSCLVKYLEMNKFCPICDVQLHKTNPLMSVRCDSTLQKLVYKLVPGLYADEMARRRKYFSELERSDNDDFDPYPIQNQFFSPDDSISLSLEYISDENGDDENNDPAHPEKQQLLHRRYLQCPAAVNMSHLKKFIRMKYELQPSYLVDIIYDGECLVDDFSLIDVAYTFNWNRNSPMKFKYRIRGKSVNRILKAKKAVIVEENHIVPTQRKRGLATLIRQQEQEPVEKQPVRIPESSLKKVDISVEERTVEAQQRPIKDEEKDLLKKDKRKERLAEDLEEDSVKEHKKVKDEQKKVKDEQKKVKDEQKKVKDEKKVRDSDDANTQRGEKSVEIRNNIRELMCKNILNPVVRPEKKKNSVESEHEPERKRARTESHVMDEEHDADDEDDERAIMTDRSDYEPAPERKEHSSKKSERKEKKKSKKQKHHHHHHHRHHDKKKDPPQAATILNKPGEDKLKLKVKLTAIKSDTNSKVTKYSVVEEFGERKDSNVSKSIPNSQEKKEEQVKEKVEKVKTSIKVPESTPSDKHEPVTPPVKTTISLTNNKVVSNSSQPRPTPSPVATVPPQQVTVPFNAVKPVPPLTSPKRIPTPTKEAAPTPIPVKPTVAEPTINNNTINHDKESTASAVNVYEQNKLSLSRKLLGNLDGMPNLHPKSVSQTTNNNGAKVSSTPSKPPPLHNINNAVSTTNNNNANTANNNAATINIKHSPANLSSSASPPPLKCRTDSVKLITGEAAKEKLMQMRAVRHKLMSKPVESTGLKMPPSSITVSKITAEEKRQMEQAKLLAARQAAQDESKRPSLEIMLVNGPPGKEKEKEKEKDREEKKEQPPTPPPKKTVRPPPPSIPLSQLNKSGRWPPKQSLIQEVLDLSGKSSRKSPDVGGPSSDQTQAMRNLMTLSDTAMQIKSIMQESELKIPLVGGKPVAYAPQLQQRQVVKPNQNVRHIPNPSALAFRQFNGMSVQQPPPVLPLRKMESMTRSIEKVAAGLGLKAAYAAK